MSEHIAPPKPFQYPIEHLADQIAEAADLRAALQMEAEAKAVVDEVLITLRMDQGWTWQQIGEVLGVTRQAAWDRLRHRVADVPGIGS